MRSWQILAALSGAIIAIVMAFASVSYTATLGTSEPAFRWLPFLTNSTLFAVLALAFDLGMVASVFGFLHWRQSSKIGAALCVALFVIASLFSIHAVRGYIATNLTKSLAPAERAADIYNSLKTELEQDQHHVARLRERGLDAGRRERAGLEQAVAQLQSKIHDTRKILAQAENGRHVSPLDGLEWFLAITLWFFNATCWTAWFGYNSRTVVTPSDTVADWLGTCDLSQPKHCSALFADYRDWCTRNEREPLAQYSLYARLVELGARKFRDGRNGPTMYVMELSRADDG